MASGQQRLDLLRRDGRLLQVVGYVSDPFYLRRIMPRRPSVLSMV
jgi:hypothetical protein